MLASIIVISHNEGDRLINTVASIAASEPNLSYELIVVDDGSSDHSVATLLETFPDTKTVRNDNPLGVSPARAKGVESAEGDIFVFFDAHVKPESGCISRLIDGILRFEGKAVLIPRVTQLDVETWQMDESMIGYGFEIALDSFLTRWIPISAMKPMDEAGVYYASPTLVGCSLAMHRDAYCDMLGFDPAMRVWGVEDVDIGVRAWMTGYPVVCDALAYLSHRFVYNFETFEVRLVDFFANQMRMARKIFYEDTWNRWLAIRRETYRARRADLLQKWELAYNQFIEDCTLTEAQREAFLARRSTDEFEYARRFNLAWPDRA